MAGYSKALNVFINDDSVGVVRQDANGRFEFTYDPTYGSTPLSLSMPVSNETYKNKVVLPYLMGLLPDNQAQRQALANQYDVPANNPVALLNYIGLDCPGAVRFLVGKDGEGAAGSVSHAGADGFAVQYAGKYVPLSEEEIGASLNRIKSDEQTSWQLPKEHWSLGGTQSKIALACFDGCWYRCVGQAATTHIIKPGIGRLHYEALNECICQNIAAAIGLSAAKASYRVFDGVPALVSERFDRVIEGPKKVLRLHQEDFCQALSVSPDNKYANEGGPGPANILTLLDKHAHGLENKFAFTLQLFFNYLIGAPDAHGKNYSVLLSQDDVTLAPLYDCASALAYDGDEVTYRAAMAIGGERRFFHLTKVNVLRYAEQAQLSDENCLQLMRGLAGSILDELDGAFAKFGQFDGVQDLARRMKPNIAHNCESVIRNLR